MRERPFRGPSWSVSGDRSDRDRLGIDAGGDFFVDRIITVEGTYLGGIPGRTVLGPGREQGRNRCCLRCRLRAMPDALDLEPPVLPMVRAAPTPRDGVVGGSGRPLGAAHSCLANRGGRRTDSAASPAVGGIGIAVGADSTTTAQPCLTGNTAASAIGLIRSRIDAATAATGAAGTERSLRDRLTLASRAALLAVLGLPAPASFAALALTALRLAPTGFCRRRIIRAGRPQETERRGEGDQGPAPGASDDQGTG
jgi:hypothetical protein